MKYIPSPTDLKIISLVFLSLSPSVTEEILRSYGSSTVAVILVAHFHSHSIVFWMTKGDSYFLTISLLRLNK